jgi:fibro-slime domain-containing protein
MRVPVSIQFTETSPGVFVYDNANFFPIDMMGFGNGPNTTIPIIGTVIPAGHNFLFTTEIHTLFTYKGGEVFTFRGDDDLWIFVNKKLAIDLGGVHGPMEGTLNMDARATELGITIGQTYPMDIFQAERHTVGSNFRIETTIDFTCVVNIPPLE